MKLKKITAPTIIVVCLMLLSACGFQLRGVTELPKIYDRVYLVDKGYSDIAIPLAQALKSSGSQIVAQTASSTAVVSLLSRGIQRRALNVGGKEIREYELQLNVTFAVQNHKGKQLADPQTITVLRTYRNDPNDVLGKENEEQIIRDEMNRMAVDRILRRLKKIQ